MSGDRADGGQGLQQALMRARLAAAFSGSTPVVWCLAAGLLSLHCIAGGVESLGGGIDGDQILLAGGLMPERVLHGQWWRLLSGPLLHRNWPHLALNVLGLVLIGRPLESAFGSLRLWWIWVGATVLGGLGSVSAGHMLTVGASASVFGFIGALVAIGLRLWDRLSPGLRMSLVLLPAAIVGLIIVMGLVADQIAGVGQVDHHAHIAGGLGGTLLGLILRLPLRDAGGMTWPIGGVRSGVIGPRILRLGGFAMAALFLAALVVAASGLGQPLKIAPPTAGSFVWQEMHVPVPASWRSGIWRGGRCEGALVDGAWALQEQRVFCFALPMGGALLIGRRDQLLTLDRGDAVAMERANGSGTFVRRQAGVLLYPLGHEHLYIVLGADALLPTWKRALEPLLPAPGKAKVAPPSAAPPASASPLDSGAAGKQASRVATGARST